MTSIEIIIGLCFFTLIAAISINVAKSTKSISEGFVVFMVGMVFMELILLSLNKTASLEAPTKTESSAPPRDIMILNPDGSELFRCEGAAEIIRVDDQIVIKTQNGEIQEVYVGGIDTMIVSKEGQ